MGLGDQQIIQITQLSSGWNCSPTSGAKRHPEHSSMRSIGQPFNQCNQLIIIPRVDKELRVICGIRVLIKSTDHTDYTVLYVLISL